MDSYYARAIFPDMEYCEHLDKLNVPTSCDFIIDSRERHFLRLPVILLILYLVALF